MKTLILIDLSNVFWASWHASEHQSVSTAYETSVSRIRSLVEKYDYAAVCCDSPPYWRRELLPTYKANREAHAAQALEQLRRVEERLVADGVLLWKCKGYEADDVIATAVRFATNGMHTLSVTIASSDKDLMQLVSDKAGVTQFSFNTSTLYTAADVEKKFDVTPQLMLDFLALTGDSGDNIPGIPGVGPKTAAQLLADFGSAEGVLLRAESIKKEKLREAVKANADSVKLGLELVALKTDAPIHFADIFVAREIKPLTEDEETPPMTEDERETEPPSAPEVEAEPIDVKQPGPPPPQKSTAIERANGNGEALVTAPSDTFEGGLQPGSLGAAYKLAKGLFNSRLYSKLPNAEAIWAVIIRGREMGLGALTALDSFHVVEGRPAPGAHLLVSRAKQHPDCEYFQFIGGDGTYAEYETKHRRNPKPTRLRYTIEQAVQAGLTQQRPGKGPGNWIKRPEEMLRKTAAVQLARIEYPESLLGAYAAEELEGVQ